MFAFVVHNKSKHVCFRFSVLRQEIGWVGWEERLRNDLFCVGRDVKP